MRIVLVGISGYGAHYLHLMDKQVGCFDELCAAVDPFAEGSPYYERLRRDGIPIYDTLEAFYEQGTADLVIISSPIQFHEAQSLCALAHGSHVLCEKPLTATLSQARNILAAQKRAGKLFGVGFQWSFADVMQRLKRSILDGAYGRPIRLSTDISWPRADAYYNESTWKGRLKDARGDLVMDSIVTNATAHYLHNIFFLLGDAMDTAQMPVTCEASLYRARPIETFDTCFLSGTFADGSEFYYGASHVGDREVTPRFHYAFEKADIRMEHDTAPVIVHWKDGRREELGTVISPVVAGEKIQRMREAVLHGMPPACTIETALPHLTLCNALFEQVQVAEFPSALVHAVQDPPRVAVDGLCDAMEACYRKGSVPTASDYAWANEPVRLSL